MATRTIATVFGGSGFIGRYVVQRLARRGFIVRVAVRDPVGAGFLKPMGAVGQIVPLFGPIVDEGHVHRALEGATWAVNLVGILAEQRRGDFDRVHGEGAGRVARIAAAAGVARLVHLSAIGADPASPSAYGRSKAAGEAAVRQAFPGATILRPSLVFGPEDAFFNRFAGMARLLPIMPVISGATRFQPVYVGDVADATLAALDRADAQGTIFELGGPDVRSFRELMEAVLTWTGRRRKLVTLPMGLARLQAQFGELIPGKPFTRDQLLMLARDAIVSAGMPGLAELGIVPTPMDLVVPDYLARFRPGGGRRIWPGQERSGSDHSSLVERAI
ncbi:MAG: complex I NDUFA9 subunit family protein [Proteobacteria bacterium]|nr:complex I NDUFA9 subunit family protein [Pseudomonadota bacterium]